MAQVVTLEDKSTGRSNSALCSEIQQRNVVSELCRTIGLLSVPTYFETVQYTIKLASLFTRVS